MDSAVSQIKAKLDIVEFIGSYIPVKKAGRNFKAICPFHKEKTPSFVISPDRQIWHCFGACGEGGDAIKFLMKWENITFIEAVKELAQKTGVKLKSAAFEDGEWKKKERSYALNSLAADYYHYILQKTRYGRKPMAYLVSRGLSPELVAAFQLGYAPSSWDSLLNFLKKKGYAPEETAAAGLLVKSERGSYYDRFRGRIMFPIRDPRGNVVGFSGRLLDGEAKEAKYVNTPETAVYHKRESLFGIHLARDAIKKEGNAILVEGEFDMIGLYQHGISNAVAAKGTAVTREQLTILHRLTPKITLCLDADEAGIEAVKRVARDAEELDFDLYVVDMGGYKDPADALQHKPAEFKKHLKSPESVYDFIIRQASSRINMAQAFGKKEFGEAVLPFIARIQNPIVQNHFLNKVSSLLEIPADSIQDLIKKHARKSAAAGLVPEKLQKKPVSREELVEKYLLSSLFQSEHTYEMADSVFTQVDADDFSYPVYQKIVAAFIDYKKTHPKILSAAAFTDSLPGQMQPACNELYLFSPGDLPSERGDIVKMALEVKRYSLKRKITALTADIGNGEKEKELSRFTARLKEVEKLLSSVYNYNL